MVARARTGALRSRLSQVVLVLLGIDAVHAFLIGPLPGPVRLSNQAVLGQRLPAHRGSVRVRASGGEDDALWGLTDLGSENFGRFGSEKDPYKDIRPRIPDLNPAWKLDDAVDFLPELREIKTRIHGANLFVVGMPGSGKSTLGRMLAEGLSYRYIDTDEHLEVKLGKTATEVFEEEGEEAWRKQETDTLRGLQTFVQTVVSTGGGIMTVKENLPMLHTGLIVWLDLDPEHIVERLRASGEIDKRPLLKQAADPAAALRELYEQRRDGFALADVRVPVDPADDAVGVIRRVVSRVNEELDLRPPKAQAWEEKRQRMKRMWDLMDKKGVATSINPENQDTRPNAAIRAIKKLAKQKAKGPFKGFAVRKPSAPPAAAAAPMSGGANIYAPGDRAGSEGQEGPAQSAEV